VTVANPQPPNNDPSEVDGGAILDAVHAAITRYVILPTREAVDDRLNVWLSGHLAELTRAEPPMPVDDGKPVTPRGTPRTDLDAAVAERNRKRSAG
jgi:hypothetical protein